MTGGGGADGVDVPSPGEAPGHGGLTRRGVWAFRAAAGTTLAALLAIGVDACTYTFTGGGGLPSHIETMYVPPVENETPRFALTEELTQLLLDATQDRLGVQLAPEQSADAMIRATITGYDDRAMNFEAREGQSADVFQRQVSIRANVEVLDLVRREVIWSGPSVVGLGAYAPDTETEEAGQQLALESLIQKIVDGAQSRW